MTTKVALATRFPGVLATVRMIFTRDRAVSMTALPDRT